MKGFVLILVGMAIITIAILGAIAVVDLIGGTFDINIDTATTLTDSIEYGGEYTDCEVIKRATYWRVDCLSMIDPGVEIMWFRPGEVAEIVEKWRGEITEGDEHESDI